MPLMAWCSGWDAVSGPAPKLTITEISPQALDARSGTCHGAQGRCMVKKSPGSRVERTLALQWVFLVLGLVAAIAELNSGTFYLAGVAVAALLTSLSGLWIRADWLPIVFLVFCIGLLPAVLLLRRRLSRGRTLPDPDVGQIVTVVSISEGSGRIVVSYRGSRWEGVLERGEMPLPGQSATITRKTDKLLHLAAGR